MQVAEKEFVSIHENSGHGPQGAGSQYVEGTLDSRPEIWLWDLNLPLTSSPCDLGQALCPSLGLELTIQITRVMAWRVAKVAASSNWTWEGDGPSHAHGLTGYAERDIIVSAKW